MYTRTDCACIAPYAIHALGVRFARFYAHIRYCVRKYTMLINACAILQIIMIHDDKKEFVPESATPKISLIFR